VEVAVQRAATNPSKFTPTLLELVKDLPNDVVLKGFEYQHPRPAVTKRVRDALCTELVQRAPRVATSDLLESFLMCTAHLSDGWLSGKLLEQLHLRPDGPALMEAAVRMRRDDGTAWLTERLAFGGTPIAGLEAAAKEFLWSAYFERRSDTHRDPNDQKHLQYWLIIALTRDQRPAKFERIRRLILESIESRGYPMESDLTLYQQFSPDFPEAGADLLQWSLSSQAPLWRKATLHLAELVRHGAVIKGMESYDSSALVRQAFTRALRDQRMPGRETIALALSRVSSSLSPSEYAILLALAEREPRSTTRDWLWQTVASFSPESAPARRFLIRQAMNPEAKTSGDALSALASAGSAGCWAALPVARWVLAQDPATLLKRSRADQLQGLSYFLSSTLGHDFGFGELHFAMCGHGMEFGYVKREDERAFSDPPPEPTHRFDDNWSGRQTEARQLLRAWIRQYDRESRKGTRTQQMPCAAMSERK
jgi:hypothetical protein